jgi:tagatose-6-phosphate ketose/aldose isomerase
MHQNETQVERAPVRSLDELIEQPAGVQREFGYAHTAHEIHHQPETWIETARGMERHQAVFVRQLADARVGAPGSGGVVLTGSGSSLFVGECLAIPLQRALKVAVNAVPSGGLLTHLDAYLPVSDGGLVVSFGRSGNSPESSAAVDEVLGARPAWHHLIITCNDRGRLAGYAGCDRVEALVLDDRTCDRSLVMTSSFTNMAVAGAALGWLGRSAAYRAGVEQLAAIATRILRDSDRLADVAARPIT